MHPTGKRVVSNTDVDDVAVLIRYENVFNAASEIEDTNGDTTALQCEPRSKDDFFIECNIWKKTDLSYLCITALNETGTPL